MGLRAFFFTLLGVFLGVAAGAATSSDVFINEVTPLALPSKDKTSDITASYANRRDVVASLRALQARQVQALSALAHLPAAKASAALIVAQKKELELRRFFYDQVIFSVDTKWNDGSLKAFFEKEFLSRAQNDIDSDADDEAAAKNPLWKFYTYLSVAIRDLPEPREDLISFIQGYVEFSSISKPKPPADYVVQRAYSNGVVNQAAHVMPQDELGDGVERLVRKHGLARAERSARAASETGSGSGSGGHAIELRMKVDMTPPADAVVPPVERQ